MIDVLPDCMMPDGADPCVGYHALQAEVARLQLSNEEAWGQVGWLEGCLEEKEGLLPLAESLKHSVAENDRLREALEEVYDKTCSEALYTRMAIHLCAAEGLQRSPVQTVLEEKKE